MLDFFVILFFGWPALLASVVSSGIGLFKYNFRLILVGAVLAFPPAWFLSGFPILRSPVFLLPLFLLGSAWAMQRSREMLAWILAIPFYLSILLLFFAVTAQ